MQLGRTSVKHTHWPLRAVSGLIGITLLGVLLACMPLSSQARDWSKDDQQRELAYTALHLLDWGQTLAIVSQPDDYHETNPILGRHPTRGEVNTYMAASLATHWAIARKLTPEKRRAFQWVSIVVKGLFVTNNNRIGLRIEF